MFYCDLNLNFVFITILLLFFAECRMMNLVLGCDCSLKRLCSVNWKSRLISVMDNKTRTKCKQLPLFCCNISFTKNKAHSEKQKAPAVASAGEGPTPIPLVCTWSLDRGKHRLPPCTCELHTEFAKERCLKLATMHLESCPLSNRDRLVHCL